MADLLHWHAGEAAPAPYALTGITAEACGGADAPGPYHRAVRLTARWYGDLVAAPLAALPARPMGRPVLGTTPANMSHV
ncbi:MULTISPECIES: hypothetical protein [unclassified Streptomyces]|uniref:hypothetical protein n=1 Tax=unclassified Streptomyces TaxID=2593676 RepID=UPI000C07EFD6|nr:MULTISPECIES: hypothetical protein [unclassified Streptomyces]MYQ42704.1 hypothetical protein [Streptomyces sp. SID4921]